MGNILVSMTEWTAQQFAVTFVWVYVVLLAIQRFIFDKPWGAQARCRKAIETNEKTRASGFDEFRSRVATNDTAVIERRKEILSWSLLELRDRLQKDDLNATQALEAYVWKAMEVQERLNCCIEVIKEAFDTANEADKNWSGKTQKPPLYGVPFSVKGNFYMPGYDCCVGLAKFLDQPRLEECTLVTHLRNIGAVPFVITNVPQALISFVCSNSVYGTTSNPHDVKRSPGGSSGGEGALFMAGGTAFGTGSDLAGSLRIPAAFCGFVTLKPTEGRFVVENTHPGVPGRSRLALSFGFYTHTVENQVALLRNVIGDPEYRKIVPRSIPAPLNEKILHDTAKLRIGYFDDDGFCPPVPCVKRCVQETVERLRQEGHELVRFTVPDVDEMVQILYKLITSDGGSYLQALYGNDVVDPYMKEFVMMLKIPRCIRYVASCLLHKISPQLSALCSAYVSNLEDLRYTQERCDDYRLKFTEYWKRLGIDALICPTFPVPAVPHQYPSRMSTAATYTALFNLLDFPAGAVPAGKVTAQDDDDLLNEAKYPTGYNIVLKTMRDAASKSVGLPLSVQVVTLPYEEEKCLRVMSEVENVWKDDHSTEDLSTCVSFRRTLVYAKHLKVTQETIHFQFGHEDEPSRTKMNLIKHEKKLGGEDFPAQIPSRPSKAIIYGGSVIVPDVYSSEHIASHGGYGYFMSDRQDRVNRLLFPDEATTESEVPPLSDVGREWSEKTPVYERLYLSPEETVFLSIDSNVLEVSESKRILTPDELWSRMKELGGSNFLKRYAVYRYLRRCGWCVRSGLPYGCQYLIYRGSPGSHHAAAGVKIETQIEPRFFIGLNRALTNMKKALVIMTPIIPDGLNTSTQRCVDSVHISMSTSTTMFVERKMNELKAKDGSELSKDKDMKDKPKEKPSMES
ncbi:unnamed protein product [Cylicocyclus nassatus]|uniref:tRNA-intron lyase n=1 Tax=Cylicocyclus nassatus TaxID=53992 RepID=A0AA36H2T4_CYLNA|nr:unnamed protein product [Cylicocyclus nassatus]